MSLGNAVSKYVYLMRQAATSFPKQLEMIHHHIFELYYHFFLQGNLFLNIIRILSQLCSTIREIPLPSPMKLVACVWSGFKSVVFCPDSNSRPHSNRPGYWPLTTDVSIYIIVCSHHSRTFKIYISIDFFLLNCVSYDEFWWPTFPSQPTVTTLHRKGRQPIRRTSSIIKK